MKVLAANLGSTSYKYRLFEVDGDSCEPLAKGGYGRVTNFGDVIRDGLDALVKDGKLASWDQLEAVGFKTVLGHRLSGCLEADQTVLDDLEQAAPLAPAHNPAYIAGIKQFAEIVPGALRVALFETAFYQWVKPAARRLAVPKAWHEAGVHRNGFHGASHKFIAERSAALLGRTDIEDRVKNLYHVAELPPADPQRPLRVVSCHLGGSSSIVGIRDGVAIGASMGMTPQSGLPQNNRVGDLDAMAVPFALKTMGLSLEEIERQLTTQSGLLGISGVSNDMRDIHEAAQGGHADAQLAIDAYVHGIRHWLGSFAFALGGLDAVVFTAGIGENSDWLRKEICRGLEGFGLQLDNELNSACRGEEAQISSAQSRVAVFVIPANEELVIARETARILQRKNVATN